MIRPYEIDEIRSHKNIAIYGAGKFGRVALKELLRIGIRPAFFIDRKAGDKTDVKEQEIPVVTVDALSGKEDTAVLIAVLHAYPEAAAELTEVPNVTLFEIGKLLDGYLENEYPIEDSLKEQVTFYHWYVKRWNGRQSLFVRHCELVLTEHCSLRCRDCANMMQYYKKPEHIEYEGMIKSFRHFISCIDGLLELKLLGGEPLLYPAFCDVLKEVVSYEKIYGINVITNGTILPDDQTISVMKNKKVLVSISDYGEKSRKLHSLIELLQRNGIRYDQMKYEEWIDVGKPEYQERTEDELKRIYQSCMMTECNTFYRGALYKCPRSAHGYHLNLYGISEDEFIDFHEESINLDVKKEKVRELVNRHQPITACAYCIGSTKEAKRIPVAVQMPR